MCVMKYKGGLKFLRKYLLQPILIFKFIITCIIQSKMNLKLPLLLLIFLSFFYSTYSIHRVHSFKQLGQYHCQSFPIQILYRLSTGQLSQIYGKQYKDLDCYIRQFINKDGQDPVEEQESQDEGQVQQQQQVLPQIDPVVIEYAQGLASCLPKQADPVESVYAIWRFVRFIIQHDYALQWIRAKVRATLGYQAQKPNAWMDGDQSAPRLRLDKLFSNQFYEYVDQLMFRDFLHPFLTFLKKNVVFAAAGPITESGKPILVQYIESKNVREKVFLPVVLQLQSGDIFTYTIPGIPLLLGGTTEKISWAFTGVLVDRSNIEQIQTLGNKFFHRDSEIWIKLENVSLPIKILGEQQPAQCKFVHSNFGTLYEKHHSQKGKVSEYISRWHEKEKKVRVVFRQLLQLITTHGQSSKKLQFPFSSLILTNQTGIHQYICYQKHPSYFLYPDLAGEPELSNQNWVSNPKRNFIIVSNTHLTTQNQESYIKRQVQNPTEEQFVIDTRRKISADGKFSLESLYQFVNSVNTDPLIKKRKDLLIHIYRKAKFLFFPDQNIRKQCDQLISILQKWDNNLKSNTGSPVFILWDYFFKQYTFNYVSSVPTGQYLAKHKIVSDVYWTGQMQLWKAGTSYGECDSYQWDNQYRKKLNGTGENSTCYFNIMRGINRTRELLRSQNGGIKQHKLSQFVSPKIFDRYNDYLGTHTQQAFGQFYSKNVAFSAQVGNKNVLFAQGYLQALNTIDYTTFSKKQVKSDVISTEL